MSLETKMTKLKQFYFGHIMGGQLSLEKTIMLEAAGKEDQI